MKDKQVTIKYSDDNHVWIEGMQFVSLNRYHELRSEAATEMRLLMDEVVELTKKNKALKSLLKQALNDEKID